MKNIDIHDVMIIDKNRKDPFYYIVKFDNLEYAYIEIQRILNSHYSYIDRIDRFMVNNSLLEKRNEYNNYSYYTTTFIFYIKYIDNFNLLKKMILAIYDRQLATLVATVMTK